MEIEEINGKEYWTLDPQEQLNWYHNASTLGCKLVEAKERGIMPTLWNANDDKAVDSVQKVIMPYSLKKNKISLGQVRIINKMLNKLFDEPTNVMEFYEIGEFVKPAKTSNFGEFFGKV